MMALDTPGCEVCSALAALRQVQVAPHGFPNKLELVQIHIKFRLIAEFIMPSESIEIAAGSAISAAIRASSSITSAFSPTVGPSENATSGHECAQRVELARDVFARMLAHAEEQRHDADRGGAFASQRWPPRCADRASASSR